MRVHSVQQNGWRSATDIAIDGMGTPRIEVRPKHEALPSFTGERKNVAFRVELLHHLEDGTSFAANVPILLDVKEGLQRRNCVFSRGGNLKLSDLFAISTKIASALSLQKSPSDAAETTRIPARIHADGQCWRG
jgi:hypothetical protein